MALTKEKKVDIVERLKGIFTSSASVVFVNFHGLSVPDVHTMRRELYERGVGYMVAKKTLVKRALESAKLSGEAPAFTGELALAYGEDLVAPAGGIAEFVKKFKNKLTIQGGVFDGVFKDKAEMTEIAAIPPLPTLRGMFVNVINSPIQGLAAVLGRIAEKKTQG